MTHDFLIGNPYTISDGFVYIKEYVMVYDRSVSVSIVSIVLVIWAIVASVVIALPLFSGNVQGSELPLLIFTMILGPVLQIIVAIGLWNLKKWSLILYVVVFVFSQVGLLLQGSGNICSLGLTLLVTGIGFSDWKKMS